VCTRSTCLQAYQHEIPFLQLLGELPELMAAGTEDHGVICTFQVFKAPLAPEFDAGDVRFEQIRERQLAHNSGGDLPDGAMWHLDLDLSSDMQGSLVYNTNLYTAEHMTELTAGYLDVLDRTVTGVDIAGPREGPEVASGFRAVASASTQKDRREPTPLLISTQILAHCRIVCIFIMRHLSREIAYVGNRQSARRCASERGLR